jgi:hypothetical protein
MNRLDVLRAFSFLARGTSLKPQITDSNRTFKTQPDPERLVAADAKRARKNAKRAAELRR